jgi:hypothetical protein
MKKAFWLVLGTLSILASVPAFSIEKFPVSDKMVVMVSQVARQNITKAQMKNGQNVPPETQAEKAKPILPSVDAKRVVEHAALSVIRETCKQAWKEDFFVFMDAERAKKIWSDKQIAYIGFLHGVSMGVYGRYLKDNGGCTPSIKRFIQ